MRAGEGFPSKQQRGFVGAVSVPRNFSGCTQETRLVVRALKILVAAGVVAVALRYIKTVTLNLYLSDLLTLERKM